MNRIKPIANNAVFSGALMQLLDVQVTCARISEDDKAAWQAAEEAVSACWTAVCAIADAHAARTLAEALHPPLAPIPDDPLPDEAQQTA